MAGPPKWRGELLEALSEAGERHQLRARDSWAGANNQAIYIDAVHGLTAPLKAFAE
jgi:hypothetical protein